LVGFYIVWSGKKRATTSQIIFTTAFASAFASLSTPLSLSGVLAAKDASTALVVDRAAR